MATMKMPCAVGTGEGFQDWIPAESYPSLGASFKWNYTANAVIIVATLLNGGSGSKSFFYVDLSNPHYLERGNFAGNVCAHTLDSSWGVGITYDSTNNTLLLTHSGYNWSDAYILPLKDSTIIS